jgi:hypothetical protein
LDRGSADQFEEVKHLLGERDTACPEAFALSALAESWRVEYRPTKAKTIGARTEQQGQVLPLYRSERKGALQGRPAPLAGETRQGNSDSVAGIDVCRMWLSVRSNRHQEISALAGAAVRTMGLSI